MAKYALDAEEWLFIELLFVATQNEPDPRPLMKYFTECAKKSLPRETLETLKQKKILSSSYKVPKTGEDFDLEGIEFSKSFTNFYFRESQELGAELWDTYPDFLYMGEKLLPAKNIIKGGFLSLEAFFNAYGKAIKYDPKLHAKILESLAWAKEHELIKFMIPEYVITRRWNDHIKMMESGDIGKFAVRVDTLEDI